MGRFLNGSQGCGGISWAGFLTALGARRVPANYIRFLTVARSDFYTHSTARLMTKTTHGLAAADVSLYKTASRGYHDRSPITHHST